MHKKIIFCLAIAALMFAVSGCSSSVKPQTIDMTIDTSLPNSLTITDKPVAPRAPTPTPTPTPTPPPVAPEPTTTSTPPTNVTSSVPVALPPVPPTNPSEVPPVPMAGQTVSIAIKDFSFNPAEITISTGATITWTNNDALSHDIMSNSFKSPLLAQGETFSQKFTTAGTYDYYCGIHPSMKGKIIVK